MKLSAIGSGTLGRMAEGSTIWYGACSGGSLPSGKEVATDGHYICK